MFIPKQKGLVSTLRNYYNLINLAYLKTYFIPKVKKRNVCINNNIIITGAGRSGTTFLAELLSRLLKTPFLTEPLRISIATDIYGLPRQARQHVPENAEWEALYKYLTSLFKGQIIHPALLHRTNLKYFNCSQNLIFKFIRANLMLPWIVRNFNVLPPIFLVRHPCAVVASQLNHGAFFKEKELQQKTSFPVPNIPFADIYEQYAPVLKTLNTVEEKAAANWCFDTMMAINHRSNNKKWITVPYEKIILSGEEEVQRILKRLGYEIKKSEILSYLDQPSSTTEGNSPLWQKDNQLRKWKTLLSQKQIDTILKTIRKFGVDYYNHNLEPDYAKIYNE